MNLQRSMLRKKEAWRRANLQCDAHVRAYFSALNPTQRRMWTCPGCGNEVRGFDRCRDEAGHLKKHCGCKARATQSINPQEWRREYKRQLRRKQGAKLRTEIAADAKAKHEAMEIAKAALIAKQAKHDAHVKQFRLTPKQKRTRYNNLTERLSVGYVKKKLRRMGIPTKSATPQIVELKREQLAMKRLSRNLKSEAREHIRNENETI